MTMSTSGEMLLAIVNDVLDFAKVEAGRLELESVALEPAQVIRGVVEICRPAGPGEGAGADAPRSIRACRSRAIGDPGRISQVLANIVNNAVKFTSARRGLRAGQGGAGLAPTRLLLEVTVQDTGIGITPDVQKTLFQAFVQADSSTTRRYGGTGLGLAISRRLVEIMGGEIGVDERAGRGSTFRFTVRLGLPASCGGRATAAQPRRPTCTPPIDVRPQTACAEATAAHRSRPLAARLLLVEDNPMNQRVVTLMTDPAGLRPRRGPGWPGGDRGRRRRQALRSDPDGLPPAGARRLPGDPPDPPARRGAGADADRRADRERVRHRPPALPGRRHERLPGQADHVRAVRVDAARAGSTAAERAAPTLRARTGGGRCAETADQPAAPRSWRSGWPAAAWPAGSRQTTRPPLVRAAPAARRRAAC